MDLTVRSYNCLKREGIHTVGELVSRTEADLLDIRNFGQKSIDEVKIKLAGMGLSLKDSPAGFDPAAAALAYSDNDWNDDTDDSSYGAVSRSTRPDDRRRHRLRGDRADLVCPAHLVHPHSRVGGAVPRFRPGRGRTPNTDRKPSAPGSSLPGRRLTRGYARGPRSKGHTTCPRPRRVPASAASPAHERLILANLATSLFEHGKITTTETKAKRLRPHAEKLITTAKKGTLHSRREVMKTVRDKDVVHKLFAEIAPSFATRDGGYTRIIKTAPRKGDNAPMAIIELVDEETVSASASRVARRAASSRPVTAAPGLPPRPVLPPCRRSAVDSATNAEDSAGSRERFGAGGRGRLRGSGRGRRRDRRCRRDRRGHRQRDRCRGQPGSRERFRAGGRGRLRGTGRRCRRREVVPRGVTGGGGLTETSDRPRRLSGVADRHRPPRSIRCSTISSGLSLQAEREMSHG